MDGAKLLIDRPTTPARAAAHRARVGEGRVEIEHGASGQSRPVRITGRAPLKLLAPDAGGSAATVYASTLGGGLVGGDQIDIDVTVADGAVAFLGTQSATKVYRASADGHGCAQRLAARVGAGAALVAWPDPLMCFADAVYEQEQRFEFAADGSLVLVDWQVAGRVARGERWAMRRYRSRNRLLIGGRAVLDDVTLLDQDDGPIGSASRAGRFDCMGSVVLAGPAVKPWAGELDAAIRASAPGRRPPLVVTSSRVAGGDVILLRFAATDSRLAVAWLREALTPTIALLGADPWARKW
ncbi:MAG: urease accessory protein UreD [Phycisphaerae bacterium]|nr:urease accessory protein UreD [Tepidisphaeraceae bacterium]